MFKQKGDKGLLLKCRYNLKNIRGMVWNWLHCQTVISATDLDSVADHSFDHKRVLEVTDAVAILCLPPLHAWNRQRHTCR